MGQNEVEKVHLAVDRSGKQMEQGSSPRLATDAGMPLPDKFFSKAGRAFPVTGARKGAELPQREVPGKHRHEVRLVGPAGLLQERWSTHVLDAAGTDKARDEGKPRLIAICPFAGKTTLAVAGQRIQIAVGTRSTPAPVPARRVTAQSEVLVFVSTVHFENWKRGPPSISLHS